MFLGLLWQNKFTIILKCLTIRLHMKKTIEELLQSQYWIIDILPEQVPKENEGQFFEIERFFLESSRLTSIKEKHVNVLLKLNCYYQISIDGEANPSPERIVKAVMERSLQIMVSDAMILSEPDELNMTVYNPDERMMKLITTISLGEGLFVWKP